MDLLLLNQHQTLVYLNSSEYRGYLAHFSAPSPKSKKITLNIFLYFSEKILSLHFRMELYSPKPKRLVIFLQKISSLYFKMKLFSPKLENHPEKGFWYSPPQKIFLIYWDDCWSSCKRKKFLYSGMTVD